MKTTNKPFVGLMIKPFNAVQALALGGVLFISACASPQSSDMYRGERKKPTQLTTVAPAPSTPTHPQQKANPSQPVQPAKPSPQRLAALKSYGLEQGAKPSQLLGLSSSAIKRALGAPGFVRKDSGVEIWQYRARDCILDLFLYKEKTGMKVTYSELRGPFLDSAGQLSCFRAILAGQTQ